MARSLAELIQENKRRFYSGEICNHFFDEENTKRTRSNKLVSDKSISDLPEQSSLWDNFKSIKQKLTDELFYAPVNQH